MAAQLYRVNLFRQYGWLLWDSRWYGGHYVLPYSVLFPPLGAALGLYGAAALSAAAAAWGFDQLVRRTWGARATLPSVLFAAGIVVPVAIGQLPFLSGEAAGLLAVVAATRGRTWIAALLSVGCGLLSPVAGVFLALVLLAWAIATPRGERRTLLVLTAVAAGPVVALGVPFPEPGSFPFWGLDLVLIVGLCGLGVLLLPNRLRALRIGLALYAGAAIILFLVPNPLGGNFARLGEALAPAAILVWSFSSGRRAVAILVALPVLFWQWSPAWSAIQAGGTDPSHTTAYFAPLLHTLAREPAVGRLEIPATQNHWETAFVAPAVSLARGWERQVDIADNPLFYGRRQVTTLAYQQWLNATGVRWVALPDVALDYSARQEAALLRHPPSYLHLVWRDAHWQLWEVEGTPGLVTGPAQLVSVGPERIVLDVRAPGSVTVRLRYTPNWSVSSGQACVTATRDGWTRVVARTPGRIELAVSLVDHDEACPSGHVQ